MPEISDYNLYNIDDLIATWKKGWQELANLAEKLGFQRDGSQNSSDSSRPPSSRVLGCSEEIIRHITSHDPSFPSPSFHSVQALAAAPDNEYTYCSSIDHLPDPNKYGVSQVDERRKLRKSLKKVTEAFATCKTLGGALQKIATPNNYKRFLKEHRLEEFKKTTLEKFLGVKIEPPWPEVMRWLGRGLRGEKACEEAWWNCVWLVMQPKVREMLEIKRRLYEDIPLTEGHISLLNEHMIYGHPVGSCFVIDDNGRKTYRVVLKANAYRIKATPLLIEWTIPLLIAAHILLVQPAFKLAQELLSRFSRPRFVRQCRAPSCGKMFYTGRKDANACPGSQGYKKNKCALEWIRYKRYLQKIGKNPEKQWHNQQLKKQFIAYDQS